MIFTKWLSLNCGSSLYSARYSLPRRVERSVTHYLRANHSMAADRMPANVRNDMLIDVLDCFLQNVWFVLLVML